MRSEVELKTGQTFVAQMNFKDGKVLLTPHGHASSIQAEKMIRILGVCPLGA